MPSTKVTNVPVLAATCDVLPVVRARYGIEIQLAGSLHQHQAIV